MLPDSGPHAAFIYAAYGAAAVIFLGLIVRAAVAAWLQKRALRLLQSGLPERRRD